MCPGAHAGDHLRLGPLVDLVVEAGFRPAWIESASREEWEEFESGYRHDTELWLARNPDRPLAAETVNESTASGRPGLTATAPSLASRT